MRFYCQQGMNRCMQGLVVEHFDALVNGFSPILRSFARYIAHYDPQSARPLPPRCVALRAAV